MLAPDWLKREEIERHSLDMRQFADFRAATLPNGTRIVEAYNGSGLALTFLPDSGLDIWAASYKGIPLTWLRPGSPQPPVLGQSWLREFNGGLLTTCGLTHAGPPESDPLTDGGRDLHGLYSRQRAYDVSTLTAWEDDEYVLCLLGTVSESKLFSEQLRLHRTYRMVLGKPTIGWQDTVTNLGDQPAPLMVLYHINLGYPLVRAGAQMVSAGTAYSRDAEARKGRDRWAEYDAATPGYAEQVYFHHVRANAGEMACAALLQADFGLRIDWNTTTMPYLTQWKNTRQGIYVCGIEPGNCLPEGQRAAERSGRLEWLQPGDSRQFTCLISVVDGPAEVAAVRAEIAANATGGSPTSARLSDFA